MTGTLAYSHCPWVNVPPPKVYEVIHCLQVQNIRDGHLFKENCSTLHGYLWALYEKPRRHIHGGNIANGRRISLVNIIFKDPSKAFLKIKTS